MISIDSAQIDAWIVAFIFPLSRILGFIATAPLWSSNGVPRRVRLVPYKLPRLLIVRL